MIEESVVKTSEEMDVIIRRQRSQIINLQEQLDEYGLAIESCRQDIAKRWMDIEDLEFNVEVFPTIIQELRDKNKDLEIQLEKALMFGGPHVDQPISTQEELEQLPHSHVEFSDVEKEQITHEVEEAKEQETSSDIDVQTKSWWRRQCKKVGKAMGNFRLRLKSCLGVKTSKTPAVRLIIVQPVNDGIRTMDIVMTPVSVGMPPVSV